MIFRLICIIFLFSPFFGLKDGRRKEAYDFVFVFVFVSKLRRIQEKVKNKNIFLQTLVTLVLN